MNKPSIPILVNDATDLLGRLVSIPSLSGGEAGAANELEAFLKHRDIPVFRLLNNVYCSNRYFDPTRPTILLNSHLDTVPANSQYTRDPLDPTIADGKLYGLGTTDAGASLVSLLAAFLYFFEEPLLSYNIVFAASAEEEISGHNGVEKLFQTEHFAGLFKEPGSFAVVGEPTGMQLAIAEKGLLVLDCMAYGKAGHAAREEGENAIYKAMKAISWFQHYRFEKVSPLLGEVKMSVTSVNTQNKAHNVIPASCSFIVDIRLNECYEHEELLGIIREQVEVDITARSTRLSASSIDLQHPIVQAGLGLGRQTYGSPTMSDQALIPIPSLKCGPGNSAQSHSADEYVLLEDIREGITLYIQLLKTVVFGKAGQPTSSIQHST